MAEVSVEVTNNVNGREIPNDRSYVKNIKAGDKYSDYGAGVGSNLNNEYLHASETLFIIYPEAEITFTGNPVRSEVTNYGTIVGGTFDNIVKNDSYVYKGHAIIKGGTFNAKVDSISGSIISGGNFNGEVKNDASIIENGNFKNQVENTANSTISGGTFEKQVTNDNGSTIKGGTFKGEVDNKGTIKSGTFSGKVENASGGTIESGDFSGKVTNNSTIESGNFSSEVENASGGTISNGNFSNEVTNDGTIKSGDFNGKVTNDGTINAGTFSDEVTNDGTIKSGDFSGEVKNDGTINNGTFSGKVENASGGTISGGDFSNEVTNDGTIKEGNFSGEIKNEGEIKKLTATDNLTISGNGSIKEIEVKNGDLKLEIQKSQFADVTSIEVGDGTKVILPSGFDINEVDFAKISGDGKIIIGNKEYSTDGVDLNPAPTPSYTPTYKPKPKPDDKKEEDNQDDQKEPEQKEEPKEEPKEPQKEPEQKEPEQKEEPKEEPKEHSSSHYDELTNPNIIELKNGSQVISIHATDNHKIIIGSGADATVAFVTTDGTGASINALNADMAGLNATNGADLLDLTGSRIGVANAGFGLDVLVLGSDSKIDFAFGFNTAIIKGAQSLHTGLGTIKSGEVAVLGDFGSWHSYMLFGAEPGSFIVTNDGANSHIFSVNESTTELIATLNGSYMANSDGALISFDNAIFI